MRLRRPQGVRRPIREGAYKFSPRALSGLALWLRADLGVTVVGSGVDTWLDQSGAGVVMRQTVDVNRMPFVPSSAGYGNMPVVTATNTTQFLVAQAASTASQPHTVFVVGEEQTVNGTLFAAGNSSNSGWLLLDSASLKIFAGATLSNPVATSSPCVMMAVFNGASSFAGVSNWLTGGTAGAAGATGVDKFAVGAYSDGLFGGVCKVAEIIVFSRVINSTEKAQLAAYFTARYRLVIT